MIRTILMIILSDFLVIFCPFYRIQKLTFWIVHLLWRKSWTRSVSTPLVLSFIFLRENEMWLFLLAPSEQGLHFLVRDWRYLRGREKRILSVLKIRSINLKKIEADYWKWRRFYCVSQLFRITRDLRCQKRLWRGFWVFLRCQSKFEG